jgi:hypothetical protein
MYLGPLRLPAALLVVGNEIGEQHGKPTGTTQEMSDEMKLTRSNKISKISAIWSAVLVSFDQAAVQI